MEKTKLRNPGSPYITSGGSRSKSWGKDITAIMMMKVLLRRGVYCVIAPVSSWGLTYSAIPPRSPHRCLSILLTVPLPRPQFASRKHPEVRCCAIVTCRPAYAAYGYAKCSNGSWLTVAAQPPQASLMESRPVGSELHFCLVESTMALYVAR